MPANVDALSSTVDRRPVELDEQERRYRQADAAVTVARIDLHLVEELETGDGNAELDRLDHCPHRPLERDERAHRAADDLGEAVQAQADLGDHRRACPRSRRAGG